MRKLESYNDDEKIKIFNEMWEVTRNEFNNSIHGDYDEHYFWEFVMECVIDVTNEDWNEHNQDKVVYPK